MSKLKNYLSVLMIIFIIGFNLWLNYPETRILADPNDNIFQYSLVARTDWIWKNYGCPWSLSCLPNLTDHVVTAWAEGYPLPFYYSHVPQIVTVGSYHLLIQPITSLFNIQYSLYQYYNLTKYLLLCLFPLSVFIALRIVGFNPIFSALGSFFAGNFSTDGLYGIDSPSFLWRGYGLTSQLYAMIFFPLGIAFTYRTLSSLSYSSSLSPKSLRLLRLLKENNLFFSILFLALTTAGHLGMGIIGLLSTIPFLFFDLNIKHILARAKKLFLIFFIVIAALAYWIIPVLLYNSYHIVSFWDPIWKFDSYGWYEVIRQFFQGEIFDWQRIPVITALSLIGFFALATNVRLFPFALCFAMWFLLYFGRTTWGGIIDLIPGMKDFHQHRFIVGIHMAAIFLIPAGINYLFDLIKTTVSSIFNRFAFAEFSAISLTERQTCGNGVSLRRGSAVLPEVREIRKPALAALSFSHFFGHAKKWEIYQNIIFYILIIIIVSALGYFTVKQTIAYASLNNKWIDEASRAYLYDEKNFQNLLSYLSSQPSARVYAGRPGNWGKSFRLGSSEMYMLLGINGFDVSQFLPETWSMMSENEQNFDERLFEDYDLLNIRSIVSSKNEGFTDKAILTQKFGPFEVYQIPTSGWFDVVSSPMFVGSDKTNFINLVHLWHRSYPRRWKMHPLISVEKKPDIPEGMQKVIEMKDEVSYINLLNSAGDASDRTRILNIFADFPFVFPESTVSGKIRNEKVEKQTYSATINVPDNCKNCSIMFKMSYHPNWQAKVDGQPAPKYAVFPFYLAVSASPGEHTVEFTYQPNRLKVILLLGETLILVLLLFRKKITKNPLR